MTDPKYVEVFELCKKLLISEPILAYPDLDKNFELITDASNLAIGTVLEQQGKPIAYMSRTLKKHEINFSPIEKEL